jgi:hypothetical protein
MKTLLVTPEGLEKLKAELDHLWRTERPATTQKVNRAASLGDRFENGGLLQLSAYFRFSLTVQNSNRFLIFTLNQNLSFFCF